MFAFVAARPVLGCRDLARSRVFWCDLLGFAAVASDARFAVLRSGDAELELRAGATGPVRVHLELRGLEELHQLLVDAGESPGELHTHLSGRRSFEVADPDGHVIVAAKAPRHAGRVGWIDLTVPEAGPVREFWREVVGFTDGAPVSMGAYDDYVLQSDGKAVAGVCHARGPNADLPPVWLVYFTVDDLQASLAEVQQRGGAVVRVAGPMAVIRDPAGAVAALYQA